MLRWIFLLGVFGLAFAQVVHAQTSPSRSTDPQPTWMGIEGTFGKGITFFAPDRSFTLTVRGRMQLLSVVVADPDLNENNPRTSFAVRRARLVFSGNVFGDALKYYLQFGFSNQDTEPDLRMPLRDAGITWQAHRDIQLRFGQMKVPFGRQRVTSSSALQMVDRSPVITELSLDRDVGAYLFSDDLFGWDGRLQYRIGLMAGDGRNRLAETDGVMPVARIQFAPMGKFEEDYEGDLTRESTFRIALAASAAYNRNTSRTKSTFGTSYQAARFDYFHIAGDLLIKFAGFSLDAEVYARNARVDSRNVVVDGVPITEWARNAWGYFVQTGFMITDHLEATARWDHLSPWGDSDPSLALEHALGGGLNYYFLAHSLKVQTDYFYLFGDTFDEGRHQIRLQMQLYF